MFPKKIEVFLCKKVKVKKLLFDFFSFFVFLFLFLIFYFCLLLYQLSSNFWLTCIFFEKTFCVVFKTSTLQCFKKIQVQLTVFDKNAVVKISRISNSRTHHETLLSFVASFSWYISQEYCAEFFKILIVN